MNPNVSEPSDGRLHASKRQPLANNCGKTASAVVDHKFVLLSAAVAAAAVQCDPCLEEVLPELEGTGLTSDDIRKAAERGDIPSADAQLSACALANVCGRLVVR